MGRPWVLLPCAQPARGGAYHREPVRGQAASGPGRAAQPARHRRLHRRRNRLDRLWPARPRRGRKPEPRHGAGAVRGAQRALRRRKARHLSGRVRPHARGSSRRFQPGADGPGQPDLHAGQPGLRPVPGAERLSGLSDRHAARLPRAAPARPAKGRAPRRRARVLRRQGTAAQAARDRASGRPVGVSPAFPRRPTGRRWTSAWPSWA